jgi:ATP-dependent protease ClpP protease subunit
MSNKKDLVYGTPVATEYRYYLDESVSSPQDYHELFELLHGAGENDCIRIIISNFGGSLATCIAIINAIRATKALTVGVLASVAYSAGGAVWLSCEAQEVQQHVGFMAHDAQGGSFGSLYQQKQSIEHEMVMLRSLYEDVYENFLTKEEIEVLLKNGDLWLNEKDICERLDKRAESFKAQQEAKSKQDQENLAQMYAELDEMASEMHSLPDWITDKVTKKQLLQFINGEIEFDIDEETKKIVVVSVDNVEK